MSHGDTVAAAPEMRALLDDARFTFRGSYLSLAGQAVTFRMDVLPKIEALLARIDGAA